MHALIQIYIPNADQETIGTMKRIRIQQASLQHTLARLLSILLFANSAG
jgi:hypothetical protein